MLRNESKLYALIIATGIVWALLAGVLSGCGPMCYHSGEYTWFTDDAPHFVREYEKAQRYLVDGVEYAGMDGYELQRIVDETFDCVERVARPYVPDAYCHEMVEPPCRECMKVLVSDQWSMSCDGREQLLDMEAPQVSCNQKGFEADPNCPCKYRGGTMRYDNENLIVVTPNLLQLRYEIVRYVSGCWNPVYDARLSACGYGERL